MILFRSIHFKPKARLLVSHYRLTAVSHMKSSDEPHTLHLLRETTARSEHYSIGFMPHHVKM